MDPGEVTSIHVQRAISGNRESLDWVVARLSPLLVAQARFRLGESLRHCDPEDIVHDAWIVALPKLDDLVSRDGRFTPVLLRFLSVTVLNKVRNLLRAQIRAGAAGLERDITSPLSGAVTRAMRVERDEMIRETLDSLDPADREVLLLRGVEQVPAKAAAIVLRISEEAVSKRYRRALAKLRARLPGTVFDELADESESPH